MSDDSGGTASLGVFEASGPFAGKIFAGGGMCTVQRRAAVGGVQQSGPRERQGGRRARAGPPANGWLSVFPKFGHQGGHVYEQTDGLQRVHRLPENSHTA